MRGKEITGVLKQYLKRSCPDYAIMIDGSWGSGKTHYIFDAIKELMGDDAVRLYRKHFAYVSLYGIDSVEDVARDLVLQWFGYKHKSKLNHTEIAFSAVSSAITASLGHINIDLSKVSKYLAKFSLRDWFICFDDFERSSIPLNEVLGFINKLVEHDNCAVVILASESDIGKASLQSNIEQKYSAILSGKHLKFESDQTKDTQSPNTPFRGIDLDTLKKQTKKVFNEDIIYQTIREKVIGLTIRFEPSIEDAYEAMIKEYKNEQDFYQYLKKQKDNIIEWFRERNCSNLRTLRQIFSVSHEVYDNMLINEANHQEQIMHNFLKYIVYFMIYYRSGGDLKAVELNGEIGSVHLQDNSHQLINGFKVLEKFCTTMSLSKDDLTHTIMVLIDEYKEAERIKSKQMGTAAGKLEYWWELEDEKVKSLLEQLKEEIKENKYPIYNYPTIIGRLIGIEDVGFNIGGLENIIGYMKINIQNNPDYNEIDRYTFMFRDSPKLQKIYNDCLDILTEKTNDKQSFSLNGTFEQIFNSKRWAEEMLDFCEKNMNEFYNRKGFIDVINIQRLTQLVEEAKVEDIYYLRRVFRKVYSGSVKHYFPDDKVKLAEFRDLLDSKNIKGINKKNAMGFLIKDIEDILKQY